MQLSAQIDAELAHYLDLYQEQHQLESLADALEQAITALRVQTLEREYTLAAQEWEDSGEAQVWGSTANDGLSVTDNE
ncbi:MAG: antitoxin [Deinococcota bacterium]